MGEMYQISATARIQDMENELAGELAELKIEIEENEILQGAPTRPFSSVCIPKDISYFRKERELLLKKGLQVAEAMPLLIQADVMQRELESCLKQEYTVDSLSLLLHQFFTDRIHQLVQCKYLHMLRWKRFCQHTNIIEQIYPLYKKQISRIMKEYDDAVQRARRLSIARECFLTETGNSSKSVTQEDVVIYLQWLVCHLHSVRTIHDYLRMLQYLPMSHNIEVTPEKLFDALADDEDKGSTITLFSSLRAPTRPSTAFSSVSGSAGKTSALLSSAGTHTVSIFNKYSTVMGFEGIFDFEVSFCLPVHKLKIEEFKPQLQYLLSHFSIDYDVDDIRNTANEMELFTLVIRKFRSIFSKEETMKTFPVYDAFETGTEHWGMKGPNMALKKEANWIPFLKLCIRCRVEERVKVCLLDNNVTNKRSSQVTLTFLFYCGFYYISGANYQIKPKQDPWQQKLMTKLKQQKDMDEILRLQSQFFQVSDSNRVMDALRQHAVAAHEPYVVQPLAVTSHHKGQHTSQIWNRIYGNSKLYQEPRCKESGSPIQINACEVENVNRNKHTTSILSSKKNRDQGYSYTSTMQLLGLDEGNEENAKDPVMTQGAYLSLLYLRHLRIRELQRICLGILNYFRSIERTLAINIFGLALNGGKLVHTAADTCWICAAKGGLGVADGMGSHYYLHSTPADYKRYVTEFMEFSEIENHDDFYTTEDGIIHTQDQRGIYIMYDVAIKDLTELENQLLLLATQYIQKGQTTSRISSARGSQCGEVDLQAWAHLSVDRFAVLLDLWRCETAFLENKRQLLDSYFEAYQHVFDVEERFALAQVITDIMHKRPRFNCSSEYFVKTYEAECVCLKLHLQLIREILNKQIDDQREYVQRIWRDGRDVEMGIEFGLPLNIITKQPVAINNSCPALKKIYLLEFHPSLGLASRIPKTLEQAYWELHHIHRPKSADESISLEKQVLNLALEKWAAMEKPESSYSLQVQKDLFSGVFIEDPLFVRDVGLSIIEASEEVENRPGAEKQSQMLHTFSRLLEIITLRHRLIEAASETALLARLYKSVAVQMGFDDFHLYLRPVQFEFAAHKEKADQPPPVFITTLLEDSSSIDRYVPSSLLLAIQEVDENHIGKFSFRTKEAVLQLIAKHGVDNMQIALACQMVQKNSLIAAVQQSLSCPKEKAVHSMDSKDGMSSNKSQDNLVGTSHCSPARESESQQLTLPLGISRSLGSRKQRLSTRKRPPEAFVSIQLEKLGPRDMMLNQFIRKKSTAGSIMKNPEEVEKIKRNLILDYCRKFNERMSQCSLRGQIIAHYNSLLGLLQDFPTARKNYFVLGQPQERKGERDSEFGLISDPRKLHQRPRSLLSTDGRTFLNLWFIPHYSEVLIMFKTLEEKVCQKALYQTLQIVAALHDIFSYLCCFARLGNSPTIGSQKAQPVAADWGGIEGIGSELQDIQAQIDNLHNPRDPATVAKLLVLKREVMFLQFDAAVRHLIRETFLSAGNVAAFQTVTDSMYQALPAMSNSVVSSLYGSLLPLPQPLDAWSHRALALFPWRTFLAREGFVPVMLGNFQSIEYSVQMCLCRLNDRDRSVANAELLGVSLLMEDVVQNGSEAFLFAEKAEELRDESVTKDEQDGAVEEKEDGEQSPGNKIVASLKAKEPISVYMALKSFLILWKQLEVFKEEWGRQKLGVEHINSVTLYKQFCKVYRLEIMYPAMKEITCRLGMEDEYERMMMDNQPLLPPKGTSEVEIKTRQLHKILESMECYMIHELQKKISKEMTLVISERARGEAALPIDFWKHSVMTENFSIMRPQIVESFVQKLKEHSQETDDEIIFRKDHLRDCLMTLACDVMGRERSNFETYSMCYENILRREHQLLYQKEQEMKGMQKSQTSSTTPTIQLADLSHEIIIEITALRAKLANLEEENAKLKDEIRKEVRQEYDALVRHLFASCFALKQDQLQSLREENSKLERLVCQLKTLSCWRQTVKQKQFQRSCTALEQEVIKVKKDYLNIKMLAEEEAVLLRQQLAALRKALSRSLSENEKMKKELEKEKWLLKEYEHRASQELRSRQQLDSMKASNMERLLNDMEEKEQRLHILSNEFEKSSKMAQIQHNKIDKEIKQVRCQLGHERNLKLDAFQRVSELQNQIYDFEAALTLRGSVAGATKKSPSSLCRSASSFRSILPGTGLLTSFRTHSSLTISRDHYQRCLTTNPKTIDSCGTITGGGRRIQRPKTVPSRLHNKVVETLLPELEEPSHHDLLLELQDFRSNQK